MPKGTAWIATGPNAPALEGGQAAQDWIEIGEVDTLREREAWEVIKKNVSHTVARRSVKFYLGVNRRPEEIPELQSDSGFWLLIDAWGTGQGLVLSTRTVVRTDSISRPMPERPPGKVNIVDLVAVHARADKEGFVFDRMT